MADTRIENVPQLSSFALPLKALGYRTTDQLFGAAVGAKLPFAKYLGLDPAALDQLLATLPRQRQAITAILRVPAPYRLGVRLDGMPRRPNFATAMSLRVAEELPPFANVISQMRPVRDQAGRGTCVAHAATAIAEQYWNTQGKGSTDLSRQYLYWDCKQHDGYPEEEGTWISVAMPLLQSGGCPLESQWPYNPVEVPGDESQGPAPEGAVKAAASFKIPGFRQLAPTAVRDLKAELAEGRAVAFSVPVFNSWYANNPEVVRSGDIVNPFPGEKAAGGHAMCMVGYEDDPSDVAGAGGRFVIRNSWNGSWGTESSTGHVGYGTIPYSYISRFGLEAFSVA